MAAAADPIPAEVWGLVLPYLRAAARSLAGRAALAGMEADDLLQSAAVACLAKWPDRDPAMPPRRAAAWLRRRGVGEMLDALRSRGRYTRPQVKDLVAGRGWRLVSLSARQTDVCGRRWHHDPRDARAVDPAEAVEAADGPGRLRALLREIGVGTTAAEFAVIWGYYGDGKKLADVGRDLGFGESRASQLRAGVIDRARQALGVS